MAPTISAPWLMMIRYHICGFVESQLLVDGIQAMRAKKILLTQVENARSAFEAERSGIMKEPYVGALIARRHFDEENARRKSIEEKAKTNLLGITLAFSVILAGFPDSANGSANSGSQAIEICLAIAFIIGLVYLMAGGLWAFDVWRVGEVFGPGPDEEASESDEQFSARLLWCLKQNQRLTTIRTNALSVSFDAVRNGLLVLSVACVVRLLLS